MSNRISNAPTRSSTGISPLLLPPPRALVRNVLLFLPLFWMPACTDTRSQPTAESAPDLSGTAVTVTSIPENTLPPSDAFPVYTPDDAQVSRADEECCTDPGAIALCWWQDAENDGVTCQSDTDCGTKTCNKDVRYGDDNKIPPNGWGLCECDSDDDCDSGICAEIDGQSVCAPSFCNGYLVCACFGGCTKGNTGEYDTPEAMCSDTEGGFPGACCEGNYPGSPDGSGIGFCSTSCDGSILGSDCEVDGDCTEALLDPYSDDCAQYVCDRGRCTVDYINAGDECAANVQVTDPTYWGTESRDLDTLSCFVGRCNTSGRCLSDATPAEGLACDDDDGNECTTEICVSGVCDHDPNPTVGDNCNEDDDACTLDECDATGTCIVGPDMDCDDNNICTYPDTCVDSDPDHIAALCSNPAVDGNAEGYGYTDSTDCADLICTGGVGVSTATDCTGYNPSSLDLQCNTYSCVDGNGEDNCTLAYLSQVGDLCSDKDACTIGDRCVDGGSAGECKATGDLDCNDLNDCTEDTCSEGTCINTADIGAACDDGNPCTLNDTCDSTKSCVPGSPKDCSSLDNQCTDGICNTSTGDCEESYLASGTSCDADSNPCTLSDACDGSGNCVAGTDKDCSSMDDTCNDGVCNTTSGLCEKDPSAKEGDSCDADGDSCTIADTCQSGVCTADTNTVDCSSYNNQCNISTCDSTTGSCVYQNTALLGQACNLDGNGCTTETCQGADTASELTCTALGSINCDDGNVCTAGACVSSGNYTYSCNNSALAATVSCDADSNGCTVDDHCNGSGTCVSGTLVTAVACETEILAAHSEFDLDCNTATCMSTGSDSYHCDPVPLSPAAGSCAADSFGCTLDTCSGSNPDIGAVCVVGDERDCSASGNLPCLIGKCVEGADGYSSSCGTDNETSGVSCDADSDGCTENDVCDGNGSCVAGAAPTCTPSAACIISECSSTGSDSYSCVETVDTDCCTIDTDCEGQGFPCDLDGTCSTLQCVSGVCQCTAAADGTDCSVEVEIASYPENCYEAACNTSAVCEVSLIAVEDVDNNLCSDIFDSAGTAFDSTNVGYLGAVAQSDSVGTQLSAGGSTLCAEDNYNASGSNNCTESGGDDLGATSPDVVYGFEFETEAATSRVDYAYLVRVEADFDVTVYAQADISAATSCKEGNNPNLDTGVQSIDWTCSYPYSDTPMPDVAEETCSTGNALAGQECCDSCTAGSSCGYVWCERGYDTAGTSCDVCSGTCDAVWEYPEGPYDCTAQVPSDTSYSSYTYMATTVIVPDEKDGTWKNAVIYVDGSGGAEGNFYVTVEKIPWISSPCERVDDDARIRNATKVGSGGKTYYDTVNNLANSNHSYSTTTCGGYDCTPTWTGDNSCHNSSSTANAFWPAESYYHIYRESSGSTYCVTVSSPTSGSNALDAVLTRYEASGASDICYEPYPTVYCERNNYLGTQERMEFTAAAGTQYLIGVSRYEGISRPCLNSSGDNCDFDIQIIEGACPASCISLSDWYGGYVGSSAVTLNGSTFPTTYTDAVIGTIYRHLVTGDTSGSGHSNAFDIGAGWDADDEVHQLDYTGSSDVEVFFSGCLYGGSGAFDGRMALYNCQGDLLVSNDDGCGASGMAAFSYTMTAAESPYYLVVDGDSSTDNGAFNIAVYYAPTCTDGLQNGTETGVDCGGSCPACPPTCDDGIQNGTETGIDCGGVSSGETCPSCGCGAGRCEDDGDCAASVPYCDLAADVIDTDGCGECRNYFVQCNPGANTYTDLDSSSGTLLSGIPLNGGCINMVMADNEAEWNETANNNRAMKLQNTGTAAAGTCAPTTTPYVLHWNTTYCKVYEESGGTVHDPTISWGTNWWDYSTSYPYAQFWHPEYCTEVGHFYGTQEISKWWDEIRIPVRRYTLNMEIYFENSTTCAMDFYVYYDTAGWGPTGTSLVCSDAINVDTTYFTINPPACDPTIPY